MLKVSDRLTVSARGTRGAAATFQIVGIPQVVAMREASTGAYQAQPSLYTGTYVVRPQDAARNAAVLVTLEVGARRVTAVADPPVTVDGRAPRVVALYPAAEHPVANLRPNVVAEIFDEESSVDPRSVRLLIDGRNVTAQTSIAETAVSYNPPRPFAPGRVQVRLTMADRAGNVRRVAWDFQVVEPPGLVRTVTLNPPTPLAGDDVLTVVATGAPGGSARFRLAGLGRTVPMRESRTTPGAYFGAYSPDPGTNLLRASLTVEVTRGGRTDRLQASTPVTILTRRPAPPVVEAPGRALVLGPGGGGGPQVVLRGRTRPGFRVVGRIAYEDAEDAVEARGTLAEFLAVAGTDGGWAVALPLAAPSGARLAATLVVVDPVGQRSPPLVIPLGRLP
ncbi:MAG: hypothetical protein QN122_04570 [Armatimonadota bacterium]|nr:hypothetical protein [Armatimonadota bacterium]MDR7458829.1 hypothetical protein [Armatimonadota bacterium]MDR7480044.1 hypothetical protein [Armatimonadota bacterium]MDR7488460.1 hypothetical protein [Armatimonadota bacterium]MDR7490709.1 hypothetical protein [Armatimonadota bacterium]